MLKRITIALLGFIASDFLAAGTMGPVCTPGNVTVPCIANAWDLGVQALYLRSVFDADKAYAIDSLFPIVNEEVKNDWDWGYRLEGSYHFNTGNDITINWTHYKGDVDFAGTHGFIPAFQVVNFPYTMHNEDRFDQVNLVMGQHVDFGLVKKMRFYGGLQYANIQARSSQLYAIVVPRIATSVSFFDNTDFKGVGPVLGIDYSYNLTDAFSLTANGASSILYGTQRYNIGYVANPVGGVIQSVYASKKAIVPNLEAKLGVNYAYAMSHGVLNIAGGYQALNYFNALQSQLNQNILGSIANSDYGLYGPYFGVTYVGMA